MPTPYDNRLLQQSIRVLADCSLENGALIAANTDKEYYPKDANNYRFVWPRDAAFVLYAAYIATNNKSYAEGFIHWLLNRAEGFAESGMLFRRYVTNGARDTEFGYQYQPDQSGELLWVLSEIFSRPNNKIKKTISLLADSLCKNWEHKNFKIATFDLWEERQTFPSLQDNFTYTLAACSYGLECAAKQLNNNKWSSTAKEMRKILNNLPGDYYYRAHGKLVDKRVDASLLGLVWPFNIVPIDYKMLNTIKLIEEQLLTPEGVMRYANDEYDGMMEQLAHRKKGGGGWPLLTYWYIIVLAKIGRQQPAKNLFSSYSKNFSQGFIPEQLFNNKLQHSVTPLCWSHAMYLLAEKIVND